MSDSETKQVETVHGPVKYDTETCAGCQQEYVPEKTVAAAFGAVEGRWGDGNSYDAHVGIRRVDGGEPDVMTYCLKCAERMGYDGPVGAGSVSVADRVQWWKVLLVTNIATLFLWFAVGAI